MPEQSSRESGVAMAAPEVAAAAARHAEAAEQAGRIAPEVMRAVARAGFARHFVPADNGGATGNFGELAEAVVTVGTACPATAWCASIVASMARIAAYLPAEGRKELWRDGADTLIVGSLSPKGKAGSADGGWRVSGSWSYVSGVEHSDWALLLALAPTDGRRPERRCFAIPRGAYRIDRTWSDVGMQATGSNTLVLDDVFVPESLSFPAEEMLSDLPPAHLDGPHAVPLPAVNGLFFCLPMLGAAEGALAYWTGYAAEKAAAATTSGPGPARGFYEETLARCSGEIDAARLLLERVVTRADSGQVTGPETARNQRDFALASDLLVTSVDRLFRASGTAGHSTASPLQRLWRDVHSAGGHVVLQFGPAAAAYSSHVFATRS